PHRANAAIVRRRTALLTDGMRDTVEIKRRSLRRRNDVANRDRAGVAREGVPTVRATSAPDKAGTSKTEQDLLDVVAGQLLDLSNFPPRDRTFVDATGQVQRTDDAVFGERSDAHVVQSNTRREAV